MTGNPSDPELAGDLVGVASARLTTAGVPREERLRALRLLGVLSTLADTDLRVRRPLAMVASEFDLPPHEVERWLDDLVTAGVVRRDGAAIVVGGREPSRDVRMTLHDFLDAADELDARPARSGLVVALLRPSSAVLAAAAVMALAFLGPAVLDRPSTRTASTRGDVSDTPTVATTADPRPSDDRTATTSEAVGSSEQDDPRVVTTTPTTSLRCPSGAPILEVTGTTVDVLGGLVVDGVARNPSGESIRIETFTLRASVDGQEVTAPGTEGELVVPAHSSVRWQAELPVIAPAGTLVRATLGDWDWQSPEARAACPSP